ncbi:MAG: hypothetical protein IPM29_18335 [Planctomycetes bacterium]|nr:hypothetical protein [Planctomycetota bacterium]
MKRARRTLVRLLASGALTLVLLELALQLLALVAGGLFGRRELAVGDRHPDDRVVLCVGDSFTFGMGASSPAAAYPAQLEARLQRELGPRWHVVNGGTPGFDSLAVATGLDQQLAEHRPDVVCVMVGINDRWRQRGRAPVGPTARSGFRLRTLELLRIAVRGLGLFDDRPPAAAEPVERTDARAFADHPLVGRWTVTPGGATAVFWPDGHGRIGPMQWQWRPTPTGLSLGEPGEEVDTGLRLEGAAALLTPAGREPLLLVRAAELDPDALAAHDRRQQFLAAITAERYGEAAALGEELLRAPDLDADAELELLPPLARARRVLGDVDGAERALARLRVLHTERRDGRSACSLANALQALGHYSEAVEVASAALQHPDADSAGLIEVFATAATQVLPRDEVLAFLDASLARGAELPAEARAALFVLRFRVVDRGDRAAALRALVDAWRTAPDAPATRFGLQMATARDFPAGLVLDTARAAGCDATEAERLLAALRPPAPPAGDEWTAVLHDNLAAIVARCQAAGAAAVIVSHPFRSGVTEDVQRAVARSFGIPWVAAGARFPADDEERAALFVADGHCNDAGYGLIADSVAEAVTALAQGR